MAKHNEYGEPIPYGLNHRQYQFAIELVETMKMGRANRTNAARNAGYQGSPESLKTTGSRLGLHEGVKKLVQELYDDFLALGLPEDLTPKEVIDALRSEMKHAKSDQARVSAATQLGRTMGLFTDRIEEVKAAPMATQLEAMANDDIRGLAGALIKELETRGEPFNFSDNVITMEGTGA